MSKLKIEQILIDNGYQLTKGLGYYSSIVVDGVCSLYTKGDINVSVGLHEKGFPPTLIHPRPKKITKGDNFISITSMRDSEVIGWIEKSSDEEIINFIENNI